MSDTLVDKSMHSLGLDSECGKVSVDSYPDSSLLWNPNRLPDGESLARRDKDYQMVGSGPRAPAALAQELLLLVAQVPLNLKSNQSLVW